MEACGAGLAAQLGARTVRLGAQLLNAAVFRAPALGVPFAPLLSWVHFSFSRCLPILSFSRCARGATAVIFAVAALPLILVAGAAIDYAGLNDKRADIQNMLDSAVLVGASMKKATPAQRKAAAELHFNTLLEEITATVPSRRYTFDLQDVAFTIVTKPGPGGVALPSGIRGVARGRVPTQVMGVVGVKTMAVNMDAEAAFASDVVRQLDMVFCIDATNSMDKTFDAVKSNAASLFTTINDKLKALGAEEMDAVRARVIFFRDFVSDRGALDQAGHPFPLKNDGTPDVTYITDNAPLNRSDFFVLRQGAGFDLINFVDNETPVGGADAPESGLVCLDQALKSNFAKAGDPLAGDASKRIAEAFPMIVMWTDENTRAINDPNQRNLPAGTSRSNAELLALWRSPNLDQRRKTLVFFGDLGNTSPTAGECFDPDGDGIAGTDRNPEGWDGFTTVTVNGEKVGRITSRQLLQSKLPVFREAPGPSYVQIANQTPFFVDRGDPQGRYAYQRNGFGPYYYLRDVPAGNGTSYYVDDNIMVFNTSRISKSYDRDAPACSATGPARWQQTVGTWGINTDVFNYTLTDGNGAFVDRLADALKEKIVTPRLTM